MFRDGTRPEAAALAEFIDAHQGRFGIEPTCAALGFPVSSYYYAKRRESEPTARESRDVILREKIMEVRKGVKGREVYGARKVWLELNRQGGRFADIAASRLAGANHPAGCRC